MMSYYKHIGMSVALVLALGNASLSAISKSAYFPMLYTVYKKNKKKFTSYIYNKKHDAGMADRYALPFAQKTVPVPTARIPFEYVKPHEYKRPVTQDITSYLKRALAYLCSSWAGLVNKTPVETVVKAEINDLNGTAAKAGTNTDTKDTHVSIEDINEAAVKADTENIDTKDTHVPIKDINETAFKADTDTDTKDTPVPWYEEEAKCVLQEFQEWYKKTDTTLPDCSSVKHVLDLNEDQQGQLVAFLYKKLVNKDDPTHFKALAFVAEGCDKLKKYTELVAFFHNNKEETVALTVFNQFRTTLSGHAEKLPKALHDANEEFKKTASVSDLTWGLWAFNAKFAKPKKV